MATIINYLSLIKFSHTIFAMPFALIGFTLGVYNYSTTIPGWHTTIFDSQHFFHSLLGIFILVILCMVFARNAAMAFNRYLDRSFDGRNPRTAIREIPAGILHAKTVLWFTILNSLLFIACTYFINSICFYLSPVALLVVLGYSYTKRFTPLCHLILGLGLSLAPIGAYLAVTGRFDIAPILLSFAVLFWVSGFDIIYAMQDETFDKENNLYSIPSILGGAKALTISTLLHILSTACVFAVGAISNVHYLYWIGVFIFGTMLIYQHRLVKPNDLSQVNVAFMTANGVASVIFSLFVIADIIFL